MNGIDVHERASFMCELGRCSYVSDSPQCVGSRADGEKFRSHIDRHSQIVEVEGSRPGIKADRSNLRAAILRHLAPGIDVRVVIELGDYDLVSGLQVTPDRSRNMMRERRHVRAERDLSRVRIQKIGECLARAREHRISLGARRIRPFGVGVVVVQVVEHGFAYLTRDLSTPRPVEVRNLMAVVNPVERGKKFPDVDSGSHHSVEKCSTCPRSADQRCRRGWIGPPYVTALMNRQLHQRYRPDIDGLRAIAVLAVVGFHAGIPGFAGGFAGVDCFFVISGYLICGVIVGPLDRGTFSFIDFYARRINRIFPALAVLLFAVLVMGWTFLYSSEMRSLGDHAAAGAAFVSNFVFENEAGYFDSARKPLLHLWSLAVEEQFYLLFPLLIVAAYKARVRLRWILGLVAVVSLASSVWSVENGDAIEAFFFPHTRFWEIFAGALLRDVQFRGLRVAGTITRHEDVVRHIASFAGSALIVSGALLIDRGSPWPGWLALLPVAGTVLLIAAGPRAFMNRIVLSNPALVGVGLISYPLYLWHFPLLEFGEIIFVKPSPALRLGIIAASGALAFLTWRFVELPIRLGNRKRRNALVLLILLVLAGLTGLAFGTGVIAPRMSPEATQNIEAAMTDFAYPESDYPRSAPAVVAHTIAGDSTATILVIGDSHAQQYWPRMIGLKQSGATNRRIRFVTYAGCAPLPEVERLGIDAGGGGFSCAAFQRKAISLALEQNVSTVVFAAWWEAHFDQWRSLRGDRERTLASRDVADTVFSLLARDIDLLRARGKAVYLVLSNPVGRPLSPEALLPSRIPFRQKRIRSRVSREEVTRRAFPITQRLRQTGTTAGAIIVDPVDHLCNELTCPAVDSSGLPIYKDDNHLRSRFVRERATWIDVVVH